MVEIYIHSLSLIEKKLRIYEYISCYIRCQEILHT